MMKRIKAFRFFFTVMTIVFVWYFIFHYFSMTVAHTEKIVINLQLGTVKRLFKAQQIIDNNIDLNPIHWQKNNYSLFSTINNKFEILNMTNIYELSKGSWAYFVPLKQLVYRIKEPKYIKTDSGLPFIIISISTVDGVNRLKVSKFKWCKSMSWRGCELWP